MTTIRTKQQTACDGVRTAWQSDTFTQILHQQVVTKFSMDGVVPPEASADILTVTPKAQYKNMTAKEEKVQEKKVGTFVETMDGIRRQWKPVRI